MGLQDAGFDVPWHAHHGMDILSYMVEGNGRHADSMGNVRPWNAGQFALLTDSFCG